LSEIGRTRLSRPVIQRPTDPYTPLYFFNVRKGGVLIRDSERDELPEREAGRQLGLEIVQDMLRLPHVYGEKREWQTNAFVITDETGATVLILPFAESEIKAELVSLRAVLSQAQMPQ
jgi:hypothetical protein